MSPSADQSTNTQIICADWILPMTGNGDCLVDHAIVIKDDKIIDLLPQQQIPQLYSELPKVNLDKQLLMPGFVNAHCHAAMNLLRGFADDLKLADWLNKAIWPAEAAFVDNDFVFQGTQHAVAEMLLSGTTCFQDMYVMPDKAAQVVQETGIRANIGMLVCEQQTSWAKNAKEHISKGLDVFDQFKHCPTVTFSFAPHAPSTVSLKTLQELATLSNELDLNLQMHIHETAEEITDFYRQHGKRPLSALKEIGLLSPLLNAVHMTQLNEEEISWLAEYACHVIHCPQSNMKLASGQCPTQKLLNAGVNLAIGTDGAASNNDLDMLEETRTACLLAKITHQDASALPAYQALYCATIGGAKALGLQDIIGSLETGKAADIIAIDLNQIETQPVYNPLSQVVYAANRNQVTHVWVNGKLLVKNRQLHSLNEQMILQNATQWRDKISK